jgi:hypothetical protein
LAKRSGRNAEGRAALRSRILTLRGRLSQREGAEARARRAEAEAVALREQLAREREAMTRLHRLSGRLAAEGGLTALLGEVLEAVISLLGAGMGTLQLVRPGRPELDLVTQRGFASGLPAFAAWPPPNAGPGSTAAARLDRMIVEDIQWRSAIPIPGTARW